MLNLITGLLFLAFFIAVLGMTRGQTRSMVRWESVIIALLGAVLGLLVGLGLGIALTNALYNLGIDHLAVPFGSLLYYAVIAGLFGVLAAVFPSIRASRIDVLQAIATQ